MTPSERWRRAEVARREAVLLEAEAILAALEATDCYVARAAALLRPDVDAHVAGAWLVGLLRGRHKELGEMVQEKNAKRGYSTGRPRRIE